MMMNGTGGDCDLSMDGMSDMDGGSMMGGMGKVIVVTIFFFKYFHSYCRCISILMLANAFSLNLGK